MKQGGTEKGVRTVLRQKRVGKSRRPKIVLTPFSLIPFSGFSLLEIVLALAILAGALAALGELMRLGDQSAAKARDETQAELLASSVMAEIVSGARALGNVNGAEFNLATEPRWAYSIAVESTEYNELLAVRVSVVQQLAPELQPARCELVRWMPNPDYLPTDTASQSSSSGSSSAGGSNLGGGRQ